MNLFGLQWFPKQFTQDYLAKYMIGGHAMKFKVFHPDYNEHREVKWRQWRMDGQPSQGVGLESCAPYAWRRAQYGHSASPSPATRMSFASLFTVFSTIVVHHSLLGASVVLQYMYLCIELWIRGWTYICNKHGWIWNKWLPTFTFKTCDF